MLTLSLPHLLDGYSDTMRDLLIQRMQCFLTDDLRNNLSLWLIGYRIFVVKHRTIRHIFKQAVHDVFRILPTQGRCRNNFREIIQFSVIIDHL